MQESSAASEEGGEGQKGKGGMEGTTALGAGGKS